MPDAYLSLAMSAVFLRSVGTASQRCTSMHQLYLHCVSSLPAGGHPTSPRRCSSAIRSTCGHCLACCIRALHSTFSMARWRNRMPWARASSCGVFVTSFMPHSGRQHDIAHLTPPAHAGGLALFHPATHQGAERCLAVFLAPVPT